MNTHTHITRHRLSRPGIAALLFGAIATTTTASAQCGPGWIETPDSGFPGTNGSVFASVRWDPDGPGPQPELLVIGGMFSAVETTPANSIAAWDGTTWTNLDGGVTEGFIFDRVSSLEVYDGKLVVGGHFAKAGTLEVNNIAMWDGSTWTALGEGIFGGFSEPEVLDMTIYDDKLVVGGAFTQTESGPANFVAAWDGSTWEPLGAGAGFAVLALETYNGELYMGGQFSSAGNAPLTNHIAKWNGSAWSSVGGGANGTVFGLHTHDGTLYAGGSFQTAGNTIVNQIAAWDGTNWEPLDSGVFGSVVSITDLDGDLYIGGVFQSASGTAASNIARWDGFAWNALGAGTDDSVRTLHPFNGQLFVGGNFRNAGNQPAKGAALWDSNGWTSFSGRQLNIEPGGLGIFEGDLVASGYVSAASGDRDAAVLRWNGLEWSTIGQGMNELAWDVDTHNGDLYAVGWFETADGNPANGIARWDGSMWTGLGSGFAGGFVTSGLCMTTFDTDLIVGGDFTSAGGNPANNVARWDGSTWSPLGDGLTGGLGYVWHLLPYQGDLVAIGEFTSTDSTPVNGVARWDGTNWQPLGTGLTGGLLPGGKAVAIFEGDLIVGGTFTHAGGTPAANIARWDGNTWSPLGAGLPDHGVAALTVYNGELYAGGQFVFDDESNTRIARWTGTEWETVGGVNGGVGHFEILESELIMTGGFSTAGDTVAPGIARWSDNPTAWFAIQPEDTQARLDETATLKAALALGYENATLRWHRDGVPLTDGPTGTGSVISGATTGSLTITNLRAADAGNYTCLADTGCAQTSSTAASLTVCVADFNADDSVNIQDVLAFLNAWNASDPLADINNDGSINTADVLAFLNAWNAGC